MRRHRFPGLVLGWAFLLAVTLITGGLFGVESALGASPQVTASLDAAVRPEAAGRPTPTLWERLPAAAADDDIPGVPLAVGATVTETVTAEDTGDVYAVTLSEGEEVHLRCDPGKTGSAEGIVHLLVPGAASVDDPIGYDEVAYNLIAGSPTRHWADFDYIPARSGIYYLWVEWTAGALNYELSVTRTSRPALDLVPDADDIPGTSAASGILEGVVSALADPDDVYAVPLTAGKPVTLQLMPLTPYANTISTLAYLTLLDGDTVALADTGGRMLIGPVQAKNNKESSSRQTAEIRYMPAKTGTYFVRVTAGSVPYGSNFAYRLRIVGDGGSAEPPDFSDVAGSPHASAIYELAAQGIVSGYADGTFRPEEPVSRQQFAKMIVKALRVSIGGTEVCPFPDVVGGMDPSDPLYPDKYVAVCAAQGITQGYANGTFGPYDAILRQQLVSMVARAAALPGPPAGYAPGFLPVQFYPEEHYLNARKAAYAGLLDGLPGVGPPFDFYVASTRGECAQVLYNLMERQ